MKRKWHKGIYGIETKAPESEFAPNDYMREIVDLREFGVPMVPVIARLSYRKHDTPSPWHVHEKCIEFIYCAAGNSEYESKGRRYRLRPGMMFVSREDEEHRQITCPKGYATFYLFFKPTANSTSRWFEAEMRKLPRLFTCGRSVPARFGRILALAANGRPGAGLQIRLQTEVQSLFLAILDSTLVSVRSATPKVIDEIAAQMRQNPEREHSIEGLVATSGMSKASFMACFKRAYGYSPHAYLLFCRVEAAKALLRQGALEREIVECLGFTTMQNLTRTFRNFTGQTPQMWLKTGRA